MLWTKPGHEDQSKLRCEVRSDLPYTLGHACLPASCSQLRFKQHRRGRGSTEVTACKMRGTLSPRVSKRRRKGKCIFIFRGGSLVRLPPLSAAITLQGRGAQFIRDYLGLALGVSRHRTGISLSGGLRQPAALGASAPRGDVTAGVQFTHRTTFMFEKRTPAPAS